MPNATQIYGSGNMTSIDRLILGINEATDGLGGLVLWGVLYIILWTTLTYAARNTPEPQAQGFLASSVIMSIVTVLLATPQFPFLNPGLIVIPASMTIVGILVVVRKNG